MPLPGLAVCLALGLAEGGLAEACAPAWLAQDQAAACTPHVEALAAAVDREGARGALFAEHLELLRESLRRGEARLCRDLADDLRDRLREGAV